jgi:hypothetical protein
MEFDKGTKTVASGVLVFPWVQLRNRNGTSFSKRTRFSPKHRITELEHRSENCESSCPFSTISGNLNDNQFLQLVWFLWLKTTQFLSNCSFEMLWFKSTKLLQLLWPFCDLKST